MEWILRTISLVCFIDPVEEIIDDITPESVDDPTQADAGLTSEQEDNLCRDDPRLVQNHMITEQQVREALWGISKKSFLPKTDRYVITSEDRNINECQCPKYI